MSFVVIGWIIHYKRHFMKRWSTLKYDVLNVLRLLLGSSYDLLFSVLKIQRANLIFLPWTGKEKRVGKNGPRKNLFFNLAIDIFASRLVIHKKKQRWLVVSLYLFHLCDFNCLFFYVPETKYHLKSSTETLFCYKRKFYSSIYIFFSCWITRDFEPWKGSERI